MSKISFPPIDRAPGTPWRSTFDERAARDEDDGRAAHLAEVGHRLHQVIVGQDDDGAAEADARGAGDDAHAREQVGDRGARRRRRR